MMEIYCLRATQGAEVVTPPTPTHTVQDVTAESGAMVMKVTKDRLGHYLDASLKREAMSEPIKLISKGQYRWHHAFSNQGRDLHSNTH